MLITPFNQQFLKLLVLEKIFYLGLKYCLLLTKSLVLNGGTTIKYFKLKKGTRQGDPISEYILTFALEIVFLMIKANQNIEPLNFFGHDFLYTVYADGTTFIIRNNNSVIELLNVLIFSVVSVLYQANLQVKLREQATWKGFMWHSVV